MSKVAVKITSPETIIEDYQDLMHIAEYEKFLPKENKTIIKLNLSWSLFYPACSTQPWQLDGILKTMKQDGYNDVLSVENQTVVTHPWKGAYGNKWLPVLKKHGLILRLLQTLNGCHLNQLLKCWRCMIFSKRS